MAGFRMPKADGPRPLMAAMPSVMSVAPLENDSGESPGELGVAHPRKPSLPLAKVGKIPAARQLCTTPWYQSSPPVPPHELFTTCGRRVGSGSARFRSQGARMKSPHSSSAKAEHELV